MTSAEPAPRAPNWRRMLPLALFVLAIIMRTGWVSRLNDDLRYLDEVEFNVIAMGLHHGQGYQSRSFRATPVLPVYLAAVYGFGGENHALGRYGQAVLGALSCLLLYGIAARTIGRAGGLLAGFLLAVYPGHIYFSGVFYVECILIFFLCLSVYLGLVTMQRQRGNGWTGLLALLTGVSFGLTALARPIFLLAIGCQCAAWLYHRSPPWRRRLGLAALLIAGSAMTIGPWSYRNYLTYHRFILISTGLGTKLWQGNNELADGSAFDRELYWNEWDLGGWRQRLARLDPARSQEVQAKYAVIERQVEQRLEDLRRQGHGDDRELAADGILAPVAIAWMKDNPLQAAGLFLKRWIPLYDAYSDTISRTAAISRGKRLVAAITFYPILLLAGAGFFIGLACRRQLAMLYLLILTVSVAYCLLNTCTRFRLPLDAFLIVFASMAIVWLWKFMVRRAHFDPTHHRWWSPRIYRRPSPMAGVASAPSPS